MNINVMNVHDELMMPPPPPDFQVEDYRILTYQLDGERTLVRLIKKVMGPLGFGGQWWLVERVAYGYEFKCGQQSLSHDVPTDMEVLAWASRNEG